MKHATYGSFAVLFGLAIGWPACAATVTYDDQAAFLAGSGATSIGALPSTGGSGTVVGPVTFRDVVGGAAAFTAVGTNEFDNELAFTNYEVFDMDIAAGAYAVGFAIHQPGYMRADGGPSNLGCNTTPCVDSQFTIEIFFGSTSLGQFSYAPPVDADVAAGGPVGFFGVHSSQLFNRVAVREIHGTGGGADGLQHIDNEYFAHFHTGSQALVPGAGPPALPEPASSALVLAALGALAAAPRVRRALKLAA